MLGASKEVAHFGITFNSVKISCSRQQKLRKTVAAPRSSVKLTLVPLNYCKNQMIFGFRLLDRAVWQTLHFPLFVFMNNNDFNKKVCFDPADLIACDL